MRMGDNGEHLGDKSLRNLRGRTTLVGQVLRGFLPEKLVIELPGLGEICLQPVFSENDATRLWQLRHSCEVVQIECPGKEALLLVEKGFAVHAVNTMLGYEPTIAAGSLSRIERGLLHGILVALFARLGLRFTVGVCAEERQAPDADFVVVEFSLGLRGDAGRAWLCASVECMAHILVSGFPYQTMFCLELGRTRVPLSQLAATKVGDVVVFDEAAALPGADPWPVCIRGGGAVFAASLGADGILTGVDASDLGTVTRDERRPARIAAQSEAAKSPPASTDTSAEILAELGRVQGSVLASLLCGAAIDGGRERAILLRLADAPWAEGEIIAFEGALAARITRKLAD
jgi:hypothetical protein